MRGRLVGSKGLRCYVSGWHSIKWMVPSIRGGFKFFLAVAALRPQAQFQQAAAVPVPIAHT